MGAGEHNSVAAASNTGRNLCKIKRGRAIIFDSFSPVGGVWLIDDDVFAIGGNELEVALAAKSARGCQYGNVACGRAESSGLDHRVGADELHCWVACAQVLNSDHSGGVARNNDNWAAGANEWLNCCSCEHSNVTTRARTVGYVGVVIHNYKFVLGQ